jgi:ABC-type multidrug transport system fused ATPase/permease subunit
MPLERLDDAALYDQLQRARRGVENRLFSTSSFLWGTISQALTLISLAAYLASFHWALPLLLVAGTMPAALIWERLQRRRYLEQRRLTQDERRMSRYIDLLSRRPAAAELRLFGFAPWLIDRAEALWRRLRDRRMHLTATEVPRTVAVDGLNALVYLAVVALSIGLLAAGGTGLGAYAAFFLLIETFQVTYGGLLWGVAIVRDDLRYIRDFFAFVDEPRLDLDAGRRLAGERPPKIVFEGAGYTYPGAARPALSGIDLTIHPGERIALVGENGAGKTTLVRLLAGLYRPTEGRILVDGVDLAELAPSSWYRRFGVVFQDYLRFQATLRENVAFGDVARAQDDAALAAAVARSGAAEVAAALAQGLDTPLGKEFRDGAELSVGQWQKLAIARTYFRRTQILVLDEPASGLDARAEAAVYAHFAQMAEDRTALLISHRLGSCRIADRILVLSDGRLVEQGTHDALLATGGEYASLYRLQAAWYGPLAR